jgi:hypothetical protein
MLNRIWIPSPNYSGRDYNGVRLIVMHTAEGARTYQDLGHFFQNPANQVSSQVGIDDTRGTIGEYVTRGNKPWTQASYNPVAVAAELCGFASWSHDVWMNSHHNMLLNAADWTREECGKAGIPIDALGDAQAQGSGRGCCQHINLGSGGGGHVDCGPGFPWPYVLDLARGASPEAQPKDDESNMFYLEFDDEGSAPLTFTNKEANGKHRVRMYCGRTCKVTLDLRTVQETFTLGYDAGPNGLAIPKDVKSGVVRFPNLSDAPAHNARVACTISESS